MLIDFNLFAHKTKGGGGVTQSILQPPQDEYLLKP